MRVPGLYTFLGCPFKSLIPFMDKIKEGMKVLKQALHAYIAQDKQFEALAEKVSRIEHEADGMKREIRNSLPRGVFMPVDKFQFFTLLRELDQILDSAEDTVVWLSFKEGVVVKEISQDFNTLVDVCVDAVSTLSEAIHLMPGAVGFIKKDKDLVLEKIRDVRQKEWESDQIAQGIVKIVFKLKVDCLTLHHLLETTKYIGNIADHAENAADILRVMIAR
ncbi:MAG TPA: TIGR00153 family protein [Candidatus Desulfofervidus auxilii]|uniref:TIGR00153 family protein n=1 Tax=Desulfofervidus auxilii TaxID=1621989 RepID=A0A7V0IAG5_DESA2|nr:TIGR00153 family protein [Candidatus Desulfofervidus auxilii]